MKKKYLVVGLGKTGLSVVTYLLEQGNKGSQITVTDSSRRPPELAAFRALNTAVTLKLGEIVVPADTTEIIVSPGVSRLQPALVAASDRGIAIIGDIELFAQAVTKPVIAITGTNGKSTVTTLVGELLRAAGYKVAVGGNIGVPALELLNKNRYYDYYVLELSSFQLETTYSLAPVAATILNISPDHLDRYADIDDYIDAKQRIYRHADNCIVNWQDPTTVPAFKEMRGKCILYNNIVDDKDADESDFKIVRYQNELWLAAGILHRKRILPCADLKLLGFHNVANVLAAIALVSSAAPLHYSSVLPVLTNFTGLKHRCELITKTSENICWINDSKATNVEASCAALTGLATEFHQRIILILGGMDKQADFSPLLMPVKRACKAVILMGTAQKKLFDQVVAKLGSCISCYAAADLVDAVRGAASIADSGDCVLLSPACASFDSYANFAARGEHFESLVKELYACPQPVV